MCHVAQTLVLAGFPDPQRTYGGRKLDLPFSRMLKTMRDADPAPRPQLGLALPVSFITAAAAVRFQNGATLKQQAVADFISVALFFLLRVGEYTMPTGNRRTRTVQFQCKDVRLWRLGQLLDHTAPLEHLLQADGVTLHIDNQKNRQRGQTVHHSAVNAWFCPAKACARCVHEIRSAGLQPDTPLSFLENNTHVVATDILNAVRMAARQTNLPANGWLRPHPHRSPFPPSVWGNGPQIKWLRNHHENWPMVERHISDLHTLSNCGSHNGSRREDDSTGELPKRGKLATIEPLHPVFCLSIPQRPLLSFFSDVDLLIQFFLKEPQSHEKKVQKGRHQQELKSQTWFRGSHDVYTTFNQFQHPWSSSKYYRREGLRP
jgi:hypothetical protein